MEIEDILALLAPVVVFGGLFICSLFACKTWISRVLFTIVMPVVYGLLGFLIMVTLGCFAMLLPEGPASIIDELAEGITVLVCLVLLAIQVRTMSGDPAGGTKIYHSKFGGRLGRPKREKLPHVVTTKQIMRR